MGETPNRTAAARISADAMRAPASPPVPCCPKRRAERGHRLSNFPSRSVHRRTAWPNDRHDHDPLVWDAAIIRGELDVDETGPHAACGELHANALYGGRDNDRGGLHGTAHVGVGPLDARDGQQHRLAARENDPIRAVDKDARGHDVVRFEDSVLDRISPGDGDDADPWALERKIDDSLTGFVDPADLNHIGVR